MNWKWFATLPIPLVFELFMLLQCYLSTIAKNGSLCKKMYVLKFCRTWLGTPTSEFNYILLWSRTEGYNDSCNWKGKRLCKKFLVNSLCEIGYSPVGGPIGLIRQPGNFRYFEVFFQYPQTCYHLDVRWCSTMLHRYHPYHTDLHAKVTYWHGDEIRSP